LALTSPTGGGRSVGIVRVRIKATEFSFLLLLLVVVVVVVEWNFGVRMCYVGQNTDQQRLLHTEIILRVPGAEFLNG